MACMTIFVLLFVLVFKASKTSNLMIVKHFQRFFRCPGAPKKDPKGRPNFIVFRIFSSWAPIGSKGRPRSVQGSPQGVQGEPQRHPREPKRAPGGAQEVPMGAQRMPKGAQGSPKGYPGYPKPIQQDPERGTVAGMPQASGKNKKTHCLV